MGGFMAAAMGADGLFHMGSNIKKTKVRGKNYSDAISDADGLGNTWLSNQATQIGDRFQDAQTGMGDLSSGWNHSLDNQGQKIADQSQLAQNKLADQTSTTQQGLADQTSLSQQGLADQTSLSQQGLADQTALAQQKMADRSNFGSQVAQGLNQDIGTGMADRHQVNMTSASTPLFQNSFNNVSGGIGNGSNIAIGGSSAGSGGGVSGGRSHGGWGGGGMPLNGDEARSGQIGGYGYTPRGGGYGGDGFDSRLGGGQRMGEGFGDRGGMTPGGGEGFGEGRQRGYSPDGMMGGGGGFYGDEGGPLMAGYEGSQSGGDSPENSQQDGEKSRGDLGDDLGLGMGVGMGMGMGRHLFGNDATEARGESLAREHAKEGVGDIEGERGGLASDAAAAEKRGPLALTNGERPLALTNGERPLALTNGERPLALTNGERPLALTNGERPLALTNGERPLALTNGEFDRDRDIPPRDNSVAQKMKDDFLAKRKAQEALRGGALKQDPLAGRGVREERNARRGQLALENGPMEELRGGYPREMGPGPELESGAIESKDSLYPMRQEILKASRNRQKRMGFRGGRDNADEEGLLEGPALEDVPMLFARGGSVSGYARGGSVGGGSRWEQLANTQDQGGFCRSSSCGSRISSGSRVRHVDMDACDGDGVNYKNIF